MSSSVLANVTIQGTLTTVGTLGQTTFAPVDLGVNSLSLVTGNLTSLITTTSSAPSGFAAAGEGAITFPGTANAYISFGTTGQPFSNSNIYAFGDFVVEAWVNPTSLANAPVLFGYGEPAAQAYLGWYFELASNGQLQWYSFLNGSLGGLQTSTSLATGTWSHIAAIHQSASKRVQLYINGQPQTFVSSSGGWTTSGTIASYTTGIIPSSAYSVIIGQLYNSSYAFNGSLTNLRIVTGPGAAQIYNNNAFTPSTSPLFPASNTAGGSLTTRLLVRVPQTQGKVQMNKITGTQLNNPSGVGAFPPAPMSGYMTDLTGLSPYGGGKYVASASSEFGVGSNPAWYAFDKSGTIWTSNLGYNTSTGVYTAANVTVDVTGSSYLGEWLQIQQPVSTVLSSYSISNRTDVNYESPNTFYVLGSRDGANWTLVNYQTGITWSSNQVQTFTSASPQAFNYYRLAINTINAGGSPRVSIREWTLNGTIEGLNLTSDGRVGLGVVNPTRALEVAGDVVCGGTLSAGNPLMFRNALYNGDMRINQRGISTNWASPTAIGTSSSVYTVDRLNLYRGSGQTGAVCAQIALSTTDQPYLDGLQYCLRSGRASGDTGTQYLALDYNLETRDSYRFAGQPVTLSLYYRTGSGMSGSTVNVIIYSSTGIDQGGRTGLTNRTTIGQVSVPLSNAWQRTTVTGSVPLNCSQVVVQISYNPSGTAGGFDYFDVTGVQLEKGLVATPFEVRPYATELALCQRYYEKSYDVGTAPGTNTNVGIIQLYGSSDGTSNMVATQRYQVMKRTAIAPTIYTAAGTAGSWSYSRSGASGTGTINDNGFSSASGYNFYIAVGAAWVPCFIQGHWVANAEL